MILQIALDTPLRRVFDYLPPRDEPDAAPRSACGCCVPFGRQRLIGILVGIATESTLACAASSSPRSTFWTSEPVFDPVTFDLLRWAAEYYHHPFGEVYAAALPVALRAGQPALHTPNSGASPSWAAKNSPAQHAARAATARAAGLAGGAGGADRR